MAAVRRAVIGGLALITALFFLSKGFSQKSDKESTADIERGRYLVEEVAKCGECHTPRNARGELEQNAWLQGAPVWIVPVRPNPNWAERVPPLAGLPSLTDRQAERVLEEGTGPEGEALRPPMHLYHINVRMRERSSHI